MAAGEGDMVTVLSLDDYEYVTGLRSAAAETRKFSQESAESSGMLGGHHNLHRAAHKATHIAMAASFAATAGEGEDKLVGMLEKAAMLVPMVGMQFGEVGMAIGVAGGIFATALLGPMKLLNDQAKEFGKALQEAGARWDKLVNKRGSDVGFDQKLGRIDAATDPAAIAAMQRSEDDTAEQKRAELEEAKRKHAALQAAAKQHEGPKESGYGAALRRAGTAVGDWTGLTDSGEEARKRADEANAALKKSTEQVRELEEAIKQAEERSEALDSKLEDASAYAEAVESEKKLTELMKEREALAERIGKEVMTPLEKAKEKQDELDKARARNVIDQDTYDRASKKNIEDLAKAEQKGPEQHNAAAVGAKEQYEAVRASIASSQRSADSPGVKELREIVEINRRQLVGIDALAKNKPEAPLGNVIPGG